MATHPSTGQLLFYTDGAVVYDAAHRPMPNGTGLGGNPGGNQPAVILQVPGQINRYWILTNSATAAAPGAVRLSEVDMTLFGNNSVASNFPAGDVGAIKAQAIPALSNVAEAMILVPHANGNDYWLITGQDATGDFNVTLITAAGVGATSLQSSNTGLTFRPGHFAYHSTSRRIAVAPTDADRNVMIFSFDDATGNLSFNSTNGFVFNSAVPTISVPPAIYDVEWSASGDYLYVSRMGDLGVQADVIQFNLTSSAITPQSVLPNSIFRSFGLQMGRDSSIYHLYQETSGGPFLLSRFAEPDSATAPVIYEVTPLGAVNFNSMQFPSFAKGRVVLTLDFSHSGSCANSPTLFFPIVDPGADSIVWTFGDGGGSNLWSPTHTYTQGQSYAVTMTAYAGDTSQSVTKNVTITQFDVQLQLVSDTTACSCELEFPKASPAPPPCTPFSVTATATGSPGAIQWYGPSGALAGQNTLTLTSVDSAGFYYVIVQDPGGSGCAAYAGVNIREYGFDDPRSNIWYFGNNGGINFNADFIPSTGADAIVGDLVSAEGTAVICDRNGQVIVSTNGEQVYDREGNILPLGMGGSQNATQSALIMPVPGDPTLYYIFVTQEVYPAVTPGYELRYAIFDLKIAPFGGLIDPDGNPANGASTVLFTKSTERITGNLSWLIAHEFGNNNFRAYRITQQGIEGPVVSNIGSDHSFAIPQNAQGYMKLSAFNTLAVALSSPGRSNVVEIFDFADSTGAVTNFRSVDLQQAGGQVYGIEFSPGAQKLFASTIGNPSTLHEFAYDSTLGTYVRKATIPVQDPSPEIGAIQMGPDGTIYVAQNNSNALGTIMANENPDAPSVFTADAFPLAGGTSSTLGLPNFIQNIVDPSQTPAITAEGVCHGFPTTFTGSGTDPIDTLTWYFGDGASQSGVGLTTVEHQYASPGTYIVTLELSNRCVGLITPALVDTITISPTPNVQSGVVSMCDGGDDERMVSVLPADATPDLIYQWSHGATTRDPLPPYDADFTVTVTNGAGCSAEGLWEVFDNRPSVELGPNLTLCENTPSLTLDAGNPGAGISYEWRRNGIFLDTTRTVTVPTTPPSAGDEYLVIIDDAFTSCTIRDSVTITINEDADFTTAAFPPTTCGALDGRIDITISASGVFTYVVQGGTGSPVTDFDVPGPSGPHSASGLSAGTYTIFVSNQVTGCANQATEVLSDGNFTATLRRADSCATNGQMRVRITTNANQSPYDYRIISSSGTVAAAGTASDGDLLGPVPPGDYTAEITKLTCTVVTQPTTIAPDPAVPITSVTVDDCAPSINVVTSTNPGYLWTGISPLPAAQNAITGQETSTAIAPAVAVGTSGQFTYTLHLEPSIAGECPVDTTFTLNINIDPPAEVTQDDACADNVNLIATPSGNYSYVWFRNGAQFNGAQQIQIGLSDHGATYRFDARNRDTGCLISSPAFTASVLGELSVTVSNAQPCEGTDFQLTATPNRPPDTYEWRLDGTLLSTANGPVLQVTDDGEGLYRVTIQATSGAFTCTASAEVQINVADVVPGSLLDQYIICPDPANTDPATREVLLNPDPRDAYISYNWFKDGVALGVTTKTLLVTEIGEYSVDVINRNSCPGSDRTDVIEECDPKISGPNAFRPGGLNTEFFLFTFFIADAPFDIFIYNRWGEMVFHSSDINFRWNGGYKNQAGQTLPPGTYSYIVRYKSSYRPDKGVMEYRGGVVLLK